VILYQVKNSYDQYIIHRHVSTYGVYGVPSTQTCTHTHTHTHTHIYTYIVPSTQTCTPSTGLSLTDRHTTHNPIHTILHAQAQRHLASLPSISVLHSIAVLMPTLTRALRGACKAWCRYCRWYLSMCALPPNKRGAARGAAMLHVAMEQHVSCHALRVAACALCPPYRSHDIRPAQFKQFLDMYSFWRGIA